MTYTSTITSASLRLRDSRLISAMLIDGVTDAEWRAALVTNNILQMGSTVSIQRIARLLRARLEPLGPELWHMTRDGDRSVATQAVFAAALGESRLLADFMRFVVREHHAVFAKHLDPYCWSTFMASCRGRDPDMPQWSEATEARLRSAVLSMLAEVGYIAETRSLRLQQVYVDPRLAAFLTGSGHGAILRCMEPNE